MFISKIEELESATSTSGGGTSATASTGIGLGGIGGGVPSIACGSCHRVVGNSYSVQLPPTNAANVASTVLGYLHGNSGRSSSLQTSNLHHYHNHTNQLHQQTGSYVPHGVHELALLTVELFKRVDICCQLLFSMIHVSNILISQKF